MGTLVSSGIVKFLYRMVDSLWLYTMDGLCALPILQSAGVAYLSAFPVNA
jgi:hypothetical protein